MHNDLAESETLDRMILITGSMDHLSCQSRGFRNKVIDSHFNNVKP